jgi:hypothetical protein
MQVQWWISNKVRAEEEIVVLRVPALAKMFASVGRQHATGQGGNLVDLFGREDTANYAIATLLVVAACRPSEQLP